MTYESQTTNKPFHKVKTEKDTFIGPSIRKHDLQLQLRRQTGQAWAICSSVIRGYLVHTTSGSSEKRLENWQNHPNFAEGINF